MVRIRKFSFPERRAPITAVSVQDNAAHTYIMSNNWVYSVPLKMPCAIHRTCQACQVCELSWVGKIIFHPAITVITPPRFITMVTIAYINHPVLPSIARIPLLWVV